MALNRLTYTIETTNTCLGNIYTRHLRHRIDAARLALARSVYEAHEAIAKLDSLRAHEDMHAAFQWNGEDALVLTIGDREIVATMTRRHK